MNKKEPDVKTNFSGVIGIEDLIKPKHKNTQKPKNNGRKTLDRINKMVK